MKDNRLIGTFKAGTKAQKEFQGEGKGKKGKGSINKYLEYIFELNKEKILKGMRSDNPEITPEEAIKIFKNQVKAIRTNKKIGVKKAIEKFSNKHLFLSATEMGLMNIKNHLTREQTNKIRYLLSKANKTPYKTTSINWGEFIWASEYKGYKNGEKTFYIAWTDVGDSEDESWIEIKEIN